MHARQVAEVAVESDGRGPSFTTRLSLHEVQGMPAVLRLRNSSSSLLSSSQGSEDEQEPCHHRHRYHYVWVVVQGRRFAEGADPEHSTFSEFCVFGAVRVRVGHVFAEVHFNAWVVGKESLFQPRGTVQHVLSFSHFRKSRPCLTAGLLPVRLVLSV